MIPLPVRPPLDARGLLITDPATVIALRNGVELDEVQADRLRRRVAEVRESAQRWADGWGVTRPAAARVLLAIAQEERQARARRAVDAGQNSRRRERRGGEVRDITTPRIVSEAGGGQWGPS